MEKINSLIQKLEDELYSSIVSHSTPPQGMGSFVFFIKLKNGNEYAVKVSDENNNDATVLRLIQKNNINIVVPELIKSFSFDDKSIVVMQKIESTLLEGIESQNMHRYIPSMVKNLKKLHAIRSDKAGYINSQSRSASFKKILLATFNGDNTAFDWKEISKREMLDETVVMKAIEKFMYEIQRVDCDLESYSLLHTDFNQRNLFVDKDSDELSGIIDWGEAMYGHPIFDFARIRMFIWHFDLSDSVVEEYYKLMNYTSDEKNLENLFWIYRIIEYLAYYSDEDNAFNKQRIQLHQDYLKSHYQI